MSLQAPFRTRRFSVDDVGFFEGTEKLLEMWFEFSSSEPDATRGLRGIPKSAWETILRIVRCKILSQVNDDKMDAYLLSESSMFIAEKRLILKTCGTTTMLAAVEPILSLVKKYFPSSKPTNLFYSHRNFLKPSLQSPCHSSFESEFEHLDGVFENGAAYALGRLNGDCWYLYLVESVDHPLAAPDQTLEILMLDLDPGIVSQFSVQESLSAEELTESVGISALFPQSLLDSYIFDPCGYSLNGIIEEDKYFTIHITPQEECSYVSFETNIILKSYTNIVSQLLSIFHPGKFSLTVFANKAAKCGWSFTAIQDQCLEGYACRDKQLCTFVSYNLTFAHFVQLSKAGKEKNHLTTSVGRW